MGAVLTHGGQTDIHDEGNLAPFATTSNAPGIPRRELKFRVFWWFSIDGDSAANYLWFILVTQHFVLKCFMDSGKPAAFTKFPSNNGKKKKVPMVSAVTSFITRNSTRLWTNKKLATRREGCSGVQTSFCRNSCTCRGTALGTEVWLLASIREA